MQQPTFQAPNPQSQPTKKALAQVKDHQLAQSVDTSSGVPVSQMSARKILIKNIAQKKNSFNSFAGGVQQSQFISVAAPTQNNINSMNSNERNCPQKQSNPKPILKVRAKKIVVAQPRKRPSTPEQNLENCLECDAMRDFIAGLQGEIQRLQNASNDLNMQIILAGGVPKEPALIPVLTGAQTTAVTQDSGLVRNLCPQCPTTHLRIQKLNNQQPKFGGQINSNSTGLQQSNNILPQTMMTGGGGAKIRQLRQLKEHESPQKVLRFHLCPNEVM